MADMEESLSNLVESVLPDGPICIVVQDSRYKELLIDLPRIVTETMTSLGRDVKQREDFAVKHLRSNMNPRARVHAGSRSAVESLLVF